MKYILLQLAQTIDATDSNIPTLTSGEVVTNTLNLAYFLAGIIAVIVIIVGGIMYTTSAGNAGSVTKAKNMILFSVIGLVVILSAFALTNFVIGRF